VEKDGLMDLYSSDNKDTTMAIYSDIRWDDDYGLIKTISIKYLKRKYPKLKVIYFGLTSDKIYEFY